MSAPPEVVTGEAMGSETHLDFVMLTHRNVSIETHTYTHAHSELCSVIANFGEMKTNTQTERERERDWK